MHDSLRRDAFLVGALLFGLALGVALIWNVTRPQDPEPVPAAAPRLTPVAIAPSGPRIHSATEEPATTSPAQTGTTDRERPPATGATKPAPAEKPGKADGAKDKDAVRIGEAAAGGRRARGASGGSGEDAVVADTSNASAEVTTKAAKPTVQMTTLTYAPSPPVVVVAPPPTSANSDLRGAGATLPAPLYLRWTDEYKKTHAGVRIEYQAIGSGGGLNAVTQGSVQFAASDTPLTKGDLLALGGDDAVVEFPACAAGLVAAYNLPGVEKPLNLTGEILAEIALGAVSKWNDAQIAAINPDVQLPDLAVTPVWRTDGCRATFVWTRWLSARSSEFEKTGAAGKQVKWPVGHGAKGNEGVAAVVQQTSGAIGYVEQPFADARKIATAHLRNPSGKFVACTPESLTAAGAAADATMSGSLLAANICDQEGDAVYPVGSYTYLIVRRDLRSCATKSDAQALADFLRWTIHDGQKLAPGLDYAPLAPAVVAKVDAALRTLTFKGEALDAPR